MNRETGQVPPPGRAPPRREAPGVGRFPAADRLCGREDLGVHRAGCLRAQPGLSEALLVFSLQKIMKRLIKRYVLKAQVDRENDEVNEGKGVPRGEPDMVAPG